MKYLRLIVALMFFLAFSEINLYSQIKSNEYLNLELLNVDKIWTNGMHNAFTDLIFYKNNWYCAFREASSHKSKDGIINIIRSKDSSNWELKKTFSVESDDLRDPKFSITKDGDLLLIFNQRFLNPIDTHIRQSVTYLTNDGEIWKGPFISDTGLGTWRWSVTWYKDKGYSVGYTGKDKTGTLYTTNDGKEWDPFFENFFPLVTTYPNETSLVFNNNDSSAYCLLRRDCGTKTAMLGQSCYPYSTWEWVDLGVRIGGPKMIQLPNGYLLAVVRLYDQKVRTSICFVNPEKHTLKEIMTLPSGGDTSYAGVVVIGKHLHISYYSSHEGVSSIYLAEVKYSF